MVGDDFAIHRQRRHRLQKALETTSRQTERGDGGGVNLRTPVAGRRSVVVGGGGIVKFVEEVPRLLPS